MPQKFGVLTEDDCVWLGSCKMAINYWSLLGVREIFGIWETVSFRTKSFQWGKMTDSVIHLLVTVSLNLLPFFFNIVFPLHYLLLRNTYHRKKMGTRFCLWPKHKLPSNTFGIDVFWNIESTNTMTHYNK